MSAPSTNNAPTKPADKTFGAPAPTSLAAIGPDKKATKAIGPVIEVAKAIKNTELIISAIRIKFILTPRVVANSSPNSNT